MALKFPNAIRKKRSVPIPTTGYIVKDSEFEKLKDWQSRYLTNTEHAEYMSIVGSLIWLQSIRLDIVFAVLYLSWFTKQPRIHHLNMAYYIIGYLYRTKNYPLVLGGSNEINVTVYTDASLGTAPKSRSISGQMIKLNDKAGAISAKSQAGQSVVLSSFEAELDGYTKAFKSGNRVLNILKELQIEHNQGMTIYSDNEAMINFVHGEGVAKGVRHMELRMWYCREQYKNGKAKLEYMSGKTIPTDKLTKLGNAEEHRVFRRAVLGLDLINFPEGMTEFPSSVNIIPDINQSVIQV